MTDTPPAEATVATPEQQIPQIDQAEAIRQAREASLLALYAEGKRLKPNELAEIVHLLPTGNRSSPATNKSDRKLTSRQEHFIRLIAEGKTQSRAYRIAYDRQKSSNQRAAIEGWRIASMPGVRERLEHVKVVSQAKAILSINDRLKIAAECAQDRSATWTERMGGIAMYNRTAGDHAPERQELSGPGAGPIQVLATGAIKLIRPTLKERIAALEQERVREEAEEAEAANMNQPVASPASEAPSAPKEADGNPS